MKKWPHLTKAHHGDWGLCMILIYWRGLLLKRVAKTLDRWTWIIARQSKRDLGRSVKPDDDLFNGQWGDR